MNEPSASIALIRIKKGKLQILSMGDCTILIKNNYGNIIKLHDESVSILDNNVIEAMKKIRSDKNVSIRQSVTQVKDMLIQNREKKNKKDGYWILGLDKSVIKNASYYEYNVKELKNICIFSDGFADWYETINLKYDYKDFYFRLEEKGARFLYEELKNKQESDIEWNMYPRFKKIDDASLIYIQI